MSFLEIVDQVIDLLRTRGRVSYHALKREFDLDDAFIADIKEELIDIQELAVDKDGKMLVWSADGATSSQPANTSPQLSQSQSPASYTPQHLVERIRAERAAMTSRSSDDGERKTITALFADLKGSTALIEGLDPEDARAIIDPALQLMMDAVHRYDGYVAQSLGDGIFALFGAPITHEDHPQRAIYAALRMQEEMRDYADTLREQGHPPLLMRVGLNTGEVVVRSIRKDDLHADYVPVGHSTNLAARMEQLSAPGSILVSEYTHKLTDGYFAFKDMGKTQVKGVDEPLNVYEVIGAGPLRTRLQMSARRGLTRFVGRQRELDQMKQALEQSRLGHGQIVGVMGEPGLGKSRLFHEFKRSIPSDSLILEAFAVSHGSTSPYLPVIELLKTYFDITPEDDDRKRREKVNGKVLTLDRSLEDIVPYLFALLGIEESEASDHEIEQDPQIRRTRTREALKQLFLRESMNQPLLLIVEDLHWIDGETQGFLDVLSESLASAHLLLLVNYRPEYRHEWGTKTYYSQFRLSPLGKAEAEEFLTFLLGTDVGLTSLKDLILERTDGTPFFMEEVVQTLTEEGALIGGRGQYRLETTPTELRISPTVQGVLAARIDRLTSEEKSLLQQLSVIGRQFPASLAKQVVEQPEAGFYRVLTSLQAKEFLYEQPAFPEVEYIFKHALTQDVAYSTVLQEQRKSLHERTGQAIEELYVDKPEDHYSDLAHHYSQSTNVEKAVGYLHLASQQAVRRSADAEAVAHLTTAIELLWTLPDGKDRAKQELQLQLALGPALVVSKSYAAPEVAYAYTRARELSHQIGDTSQLFPILQGLWMTHSVTGEIKTACDISQQIKVLADESSNTLQQMEAHYILGIPLWWIGELTRGRTCLEHAVGLYDPQRHASLRFVYGHDPGVSGYDQLSYPLWVLGYPEQAQQAVKNALTLAHKLSHPWSIAYALAFAAGQALFWRNYSLAQEYAEATLALSAEHEFDWWTAMANVFCGKALVEQGQSVKGLSQIQQGIEAKRTMGAPIWWPYYLALLADAYRHTGQVKKGWKALAEALAAVSTTEERWMEAELHRLKGELTLQRSEAQEEAEACFHKAIEIAQQQEAKSWELRAAMSLARLWQGQGKTTEARNLLTPAYNWFTEGFDTGDLKDAKALLEDLR